MIAIYVVSLLTPASDKVMARFDDANKAYNAAR
jgi:sodium/proline symporter